MPSSQNIDRANPQVRTAHLLLSVRFKNLCISHVGILSWGNLIYPTSYIDFSVEIEGVCRRIL